LIVEGLRIIADDCEAARLQPVNIPKIAATAMFVEAQYEMIITAAVYPCFAVSLSQQPDVAAIVGGSIFA
jgi:hypothetical protein